MRMTPYPFVLLLVLAACSLGTRARSYPPAQGPAGAMVTIALAENRVVAGELLAVEDTALLLVEKEQLVRVDLASIRSLSGPKISAGRRSFTGPVRERLRLISRYPQGVTPELEARLLQAYAMTAVRRIP